MQEQPLARPKALVLLGFSGAGKDTLCNMAQARFVGVGNCKFGAFNKLLVANALGVAPSAFEDKQWRSNTNLLTTEFGLPDSGLHLSPLDVLSALFVGGSSDTEAGRHYRECYQSYTITKARAFASPVFTDVRHESEILAVREAFDTCVVNLLVPGLEPSINDTHVLKLADTYANNWLVRGSSPSETFQELLTYTEDYWSLLT